METSKEEEKKILENKELTSLIESLHLLGTLNLKLKDDLEKAKVKLSEHCDEIKTELVEIKNKSLEFVDECEKNLCNELEAYERNFNAKFDLEDSNTKKDTINLIIEADSFLNKYSSGGDEKEDGDAFEKAQLLVQELEKEIIEYEKKLAIENLIEFESKYEELSFNLIGRFVNQNYDYVTKLNIVQFETDVYQGLATKSWVAKIQPLKSGEYILALYDDKNETFKVMKLDRDGKLLKKEENLLILKQKLRNFKMIRLNDSIIFYFSFLYGYYDMDPLRPYEYDEKKMAIFLLLSIDEELKVLNKINLGFSLHMICSFENEIYVLTDWKYRGNYSMLIFDSNLNKVNELGQDSDFSDENKPFGFSTSIIEFEVNSSAFFLLNDFKIRIMDRESGMVKREIVINSLNIFLLKNKFILTYNKLNHTLYYYDFDGDLYYAKKIDKISPQSNLISVLDERLVFFDSESFIAYSFIV